MHLAAGHCDCSSKLTDEVVNKVVLAFTLTNKDGGASASSGRAASSTPGVLPKLLGNLSRLADSLKIRFASLKSLG